MKCHTIKLVQSIRGMAMLSTTTPENLGAFMGARGFTQISTRLQPVGVDFQYREEILGLPIYDELHGPMYDGEGVARYEDAETYKALST